MFEYSDGHFDELCRAPAVREQIASLQTNRRAAVKSFWLTLAGGIVLAIAAAVSLQMAGWPTAAWILAAIFLFGGVALAIRPLTAAGESLKLPVLEALAEKGGMEYLPDGFSPPVYPVARNALFGSWLSSESFTDLFHGKDEAGQGHAFYEACLTRRQGKNTHTIFSGQVYALERARAGQAVTVVVPDRGIFNFFKPERGMERVKFESDPDFEKRFEVYSTHEVEAKQLLFDSALRARLLELRKGGRVFAYFGPEGALVAATGRNRFEPGSMFRRKGGEERARMMFDDVCASMKMLRDLKGRLG